MSDEPDVTTPTPREEYLTLGQNLQLSEKDIAPDCVAYLNGVEISAMIGRLGEFQGVMFPSSSYDRAITTIMRSIEVARNTLSASNASMPLPAPGPA